MRAAKSPEPRRSSALPAGGRLALQAAVFAAAVAVLPVRVTGSGGGSSGAEFLRVAMGARPAALGENFVGLADDVSAAAWNPAGLGRIRHVELSAMHLSYLEDISYEFLAASYPFGETGSLAFSAVYMSVAPFDSTAPGSGQPSGSAADGMAALSWGGAMRALVPAYPAFERLYYGISAKFIYRQLGGYVPAGSATEESYTATAAAADIGFLYEFAPAFSAGLSLQNIGSPVTFLGDESDALPLAFRVGVGWRAVEKPAFRTTILADIVKPVDADGGEFESGTWGGLGVEATVIEMLAVRAGFRSGADGPRVVGGVGVSYAGFSLDYAFVPLGDSGVFSPGDFGDAHRFSLTARFGARPARLKAAANLTAETAAKRGVALKWDPVPGAAGYHVGVRGPDAKDFQRMTDKPREEPGITLRGLKSGAEYAFRVMAVDAGGRTGAAREVTFATPKVKAAVLGAPRGLAAVATGNRSVKLSWNEVADAAGYDVYFRRSGAGKGKWQKLNKSPRTSPSLTLRNLKGSAYEFTVSTVNADGKGGKGAKPVRVTVVP